MASYQSLGITAVLSPIPGIPAGQNIVTVTIHAVIPWDFTAPTLCKALVSSHFIDHLTSAKQLL